MDEYWDLGMGEYLDRLVTEDDSAATKVVANGREPTSVANARRAFIERGQVPPSRCNSDSRSSGRPGERTQREFFGDGGTLGSRS
jgi:hypothetical protein